MELPVKRWSYLLATLFLIAGIVLTAVSYLRLCSTTCNDAHNYRLFGFPFEVGGALYFSLLAFLHFGSLKRPSLQRYILPLVVIGLGAEAFFIAVQKWQIGAYCPVCLGIAASIALFGLSTYFETLKQGISMKRIFNFSCLFAIGVATAFLGISKIDQLQATEDKIKQEIKFGDPTSTVEVYVFTDWACPACRAIEPALEKMAPKVSQQAQLTFVDTVVHPETLNYAPYNLSFMVNAKSKYFDVREALTKLALTTKKPTDQDIVKAVAPLKITYKELPYEDVTVAMRYFDELVERFKVTGTPTVVIVNRNAKKGKKLAGVEEITEANVLKAIKTIR